MFDLVLNVAFLLVLLDGSLGIEVTTNSVVEIPTHLSVSPFENIEFNKRVRNDSIHLKLLYVGLNIIEGDAQLIWKYKGDILAIQKEDKRSTVYVEKVPNDASKQMTFTLNLKDASALPGEYQLTIKQGSEVASATANVTSAPMLPFYSKAKRVLQGDPLRLSCRIVGNPLPLSVSWSFAPLSMDKSDDKASITAAFQNLKPLDEAMPGLEGLTLVGEDGTHNDTLRIAQLAPANNGIYACNAKNEFGADSTFILVDVKDRWAALWPFIGIVIEVMVLVTAIIFYERYKMRPKPATNDSNANADNASRNAPSGTDADKNAKVDDVRLRSAPKA